MTDVCHTSPKVVLVGPPGAGKSTIGRRLARALSLPLVRALGAGSVAPLDFHPPSGLLVVIAVVGVLSGVLAAIPLAWYVSRGETLDALRSV